MNRLVALLIAAFALLPATTLAAPIPSPALSTILAPPPKTDYQEGSASNSTLLEGQFDAKTFVTKTRAPNADEVQQTLARDGFVDGYWRTWVEQGTQHVMVEIVIAFTGGDGAKRWLGASELADKADASYTKALTITGIDNYYGAHFVYATTTSGSSSSPRKTTSPRAHPPRRPRSTSWRPTPPFRNRNGPNR